jgi:hypothetical protein
MPRRKVLRKNYSKKANRKINSKSRKRLGRGLFRRTKIHPVVSVSRSSVSPRLTASTPPVAQQYDTYANFVSNMPRNIGIIKQSAQELEKIYNNYPELFNKIRDGYTQFAQQGSYLSSYNDSYNRYYDLGNEVRATRDIDIKSLIESLPYKQQYSKEEKDEALKTLAAIDSFSREFLENITLDKDLSSESFDEAEENIFNRFTDILTLINGTSTTRFLVNQYL